MRMQSFTHSIMGNLMLLGTLLFASTHPFATAAPYRNISVEAMPLGEAHVFHDRFNISRRQDTEEDDTRECTSYQDCKMKYFKNLPIDTVNDLAPPDKPKKSSTPGPKVEPVMPLGNLQCQPAPNGKYRDSHRLMVERVSREFCNVYCATDDVDPDILPIVKMFSGDNPIWGSTTVEDWSQGYLRSQKIKKQDDVYDYRVDLIEGCTPEKTPSGVYNLRRPLEVDGCQEIMFAAWSRCDNKGRGGSLEAGCFKYSIATRF